MTASIADEVKQLARSGKSAQSKNQKHQKSDVVKKVDGRRNNRGHKGKAGRKPLAEDEGRKTTKQSWEEFGNEEIEVTHLDAGTQEQRKVKMKRLRVAQERLFKKVNDGDIAAIREFNDRVGGKAMQPIVGDATEDPIQIDHDVTPILEKVYGADFNEEE